jgi:hypothetical protein
LIPELPQKVKKWWRGLRTFHFSGPDHVEEPFPAKNEGLEPLALQDEPTLDDVTDTTRNVTEVLETHLSALSEKLDSLDSRIQSKDEQEESRKDRQISGLIDELKLLKSGLYNQKADALIESLITLHLHFHMTIVVTPEAGVGPFPSLLKELEMILQANGVRQYSGGEKGGPFDGGRQQVVSVVDTGDESLDNTVAEQVNIGFETADKIIRFETVTVYRFVDKV